ncbi:MAG TPA: M20 family metallo-hydrolase [Prolixibacteraceae bacterium]|nr:M20 family metallo-hydrolase [Prolixibacteraceae bacterium]
METEKLSGESIALLKQLIQIPSLSGKEEGVAQLIRDFLSDKGISFETRLNNTWCRNRFWDERKPVLLLNSHIDTVKPVDGWTYDPFAATEEEGKIIGLGSNDAGAPLVSLLALFRFFYGKPGLPYNLIFSATAEEESSGPNGMALLVNELGRIDFALVGEPTQMNLAVAEKGLVVLDCLAKGKAGHAARNEGINSIYIALDDIRILRDYRFDKVSDLLGEVKMTVTQIEAGFQHNVIPDTCRFVVDVRTNERYSNEEIVPIVRGLIQSEVHARSLRLNSSGIRTDHPFVRKAVEKGIPCYGSPTLSDQSLMPFPSVKIGPGDSARSHTANEYIYPDEIRNGIKIYIDLLADLVL